MVTAKNDIGISGLHHIAIRAENFDQTVGFYTQVLGYTIGHTWSLPEFNLKQAAMLKSPDGLSYIEIYDREADIPAQGRKKLVQEEFVQTALLHICLTVKDSKIAYEMAIANGAIPCHEPMILHLGNPAIIVRNSLVYSPNGEVIEFLEQADF
ncbi:catechol 2,3-dioxygenase-like lactoylglutathione lyase family enzyme [Pedobacter cryoconitis]|uniref:Catechol 2,3-dioxygenase-like lactoylglutathione lyase family enzyme n=1 Tax=Pedobacter cryoconitis TaxID=188932 RepID=A0A7W9E2G9_9SPHI|nr:VOC family protein [Pedobacter cryoconitis]MBB5638755.1 catechol 2,3-dioxygenase-like lactoylglutathione lyase family enzyme [Pedobacter cryoconitis]MBB6270235.1 catechol 2,3-dioxygenase-like lactoylglutathione lyase family enzyme [Pedobacter cryoconitis]